MRATAPSAQTCWWVPPCPGEWWPRGARQVALAMWHCVLSCTRCHLCCPPRGTAHVGFAVLCVPGGLTLSLSFSCFFSFSYLGCRLGWEEQAAHVCLLGGGYRVDAGVLSWWVGLPSPTCLCAPCLLPLHRREATVDRLEPTMRVMTPRQGARVMWL